MHRRRRDASASWRCCWSNRGDSAGLTRRAPAWRGGGEYEQLSEKKLKNAAKEIIQKGVKELSDAQELLWASDTYALLVVFDAAGKDSTIEHVMSGVNPQGVQVVSFRQPSAEELDHDFLWRISRALPERGRIGIFNRSHYEQVVALKVHPEWLEGQRLPPGKRGRQFWRGRYDDINAFERHLDRSGTKIVKSSTSPRLSRSAGSWPGWTRPARSGSSRRPMWPSGRTGRVHPGVRGRDHGDLGAVGALVRDPRRPQAGHAGDRRPSWSRRSRGSDCPGQR
jgi:Polyphosphate kinase 2 (PPK2)